GFGCHRPVDEDDTHGASVSLGWVVHAFLSLKARVLLGARRLIEILYRPAPRSWTRTEPPLRASDVKADQPGEAAQADETLDAGKTSRGRQAGPKGTSGRRSTGGSELPALTLLANPRASERTTPSMEAIRENATALEHVLGDFGVRGEIINARPGPVVTLYELEPAPGIKSSRVIGLADDIARSMSA